MHLDDYPAILLVLRDHVGAELVALLSDGGGDGRDKLGGREL